MIDQTSWLGFCKFSSRWEARAPPVINKKQGKLTKDKPRGNIKERREVLSDFKK
jgi:hypothetical protein